MSRFTKIVLYCMLYGIVYGMAWHGKSYGITWCGIVCGMVWHGMWYAKAYGM